MNFAEWVTQCPDDEPMELAARALDEDPKMVLPVIAEEVAHLRRVEVRANELLSVQAFLKNVGAAPLLALPDMSSLPKLLPPSEPFALGYGVRVTWGQATIEQEQRIRMLEAMKRGLKAP